MFISIAADLQQKNFYFEAIVNVPGYPSFIFIQLFNLHNLENVILNGN